MKRAILMSVILCIALLFVAGCGSREEEDYDPYISQEELDSIWEELIAFGEEHKDVLNEMSRYFVDAVDKEVFYQAKDKESCSKQFPSIRKLAEAITDEESRLVLEKLSPAYTDGDCVHHNKFIAIYYLYDTRKAFSYYIVYLDAEGKRLKQYLDNDYDTGVGLRRSRAHKLDEHLYVVEAYFPGC